MPNTTPGTHVLKVTRPENAPIAERVFMFQFALDHVAENLGVVMRMSAEALPGFDDVVIDDPQRPKPQVPFIEVVAERKSMAAVEPAQFRLAALGQTAV